MISKSFICENIVKVRWKILISFVVNFILFSAVKEFWKSVKISESYCQKFSGFLFWNAVYMYTYSFIYA